MQEPKVQSDNITGDVLEKIREQEARVEWKPFVTFRERASGETGPRAPWEAGNSWLDRPGRGALEFDHADSWAGAITVRLSLPDGTSHAFMLDEPQVATLEWGLRNWLAGTLNGQADAEPAEVLDTFR